MILAAGLGTRMRPLTDHTPKPLLMAGGKPLIVWHIEKLARAGFSDIVINLAWLGWKIPEALGDGSQWRVRLHYSDEQQEGALETAGGIIKALPLLGDAPFLVLNGDVWCDYPCLPRTLPPHTLAHLVLVNNPTHHPTGDFALDKQGLVLDKNVETTLPPYTFSGIGYYHPTLFADLPYGKQALAPLLRQAMLTGQVSGEYFGGDWRDIGTPERLAELDQALKARQV